MDLLGKRNGRNAADCMAEDQSTGAHRSSFSKGAIHLLGSVFHAEVSNILSSQGTTPSNFILLSKVERWLMASFKTK
jgi:hypothetical protein